MRNTRRQKSTRQLYGGMNSWSLPSNNSNKWSIHSNTSPPNLNNSTNMFLNNSTNINSNTSSKNSVPKIKGILRRNNGTRSKNFSSRIRFSNSPNDVSGISIKNSAKNRNYTLKNTSNLHNLMESRRSVKRASIPFRNVRLTPELRELFTEIWTTSNTFNDMYKKISSLPISEYEKSYLIHHLSYLSYNTNKK